MKLKLISFATIFVMVVLTACNVSNKKSTDADNKIDVVVSIPTQAQLVKAVAGDRVNVTSLTSSSVNPETFEPALNALVALQNSDLYMPVGTLSFESAMIKHIDQSTSSTVVADMSDGIKFLYGTHEHHHDHDLDDDDHEHGHNHGSADPHVWSSPRNLSLMVENIENALSAIDEPNRNFYHENATRLKNHIDSIDHAIHAVTDTLSCRTFIVWHPSLSYFAQDYELNQLVVGSHGKELSVKQLHERLDKAANENVRVFFFQTEFDSDNATEIKNRTGARMITINPMDADWENQFKLITDGLRQQ